MSKLNVEEILSKLVSFPVLGGESNLEIIHWIKQYIESYGVTTVLLPNEEGNKASLHCRIGPAVDGGVILSGHTDVVPVKGQDWNYAEDLKIETFYFDTTVVNPPLRALATGAPQVLEDAGDQLEKIHQQYANEGLSSGVRYWFWNLTATVTLSNMEKSGMIKPGPDDMFLVTRLRK